MLPLLKDLISTNPFADEVDFSERGIYAIDAHSVQILARFQELTRLDLSDNEIYKLPPDLDLLVRITDLNLSGNPIESLHNTVEALATMPNLESL